MADVDTHHFLRVGPVGFVLSNHDTADLRPGAPDSVWELRGDLPADTAVLVRSIRYAVVLRAYSELGVDDDASARAATAVLDALSGASSLVSLSIDSIAMGDDGCARLASLLPDLHLSTLELQSAGIGPVGVAALCGVLPTTRIHRLDLSRNRIGSEGATTLALALPGAHALGHLDLSGCNVETSGAVALASALPISRLMSLELRGAHLGDEAATAFARALSCGSTALRQLDLKGNSIGEAGASAIADALRFNTELAWLSIGCATRGSTLAPRFAETVFAHNGALRDVRVYQLDRRNRYQPREYRRKLARQRAALLTLVLCSTGDGLAADVVPRLLGGLGINRDGDDAMKRTFRGFALEFERLELRR